MLEQKPIACPWALSMIQIGINSCTNYDMKGKEQHDLNFHCRKQSCRLLPGNCKTPFQDMMIMIHTPPKGQPGPPPPPGHRP